MNGPHLKQMLIFDVPIKRCFRFGQVLIRFKNMCYISIWLCCCFFFFVVVVVVVVVVAVVVVAFVLKTFFASKSENDMKLQIRKEFGVRER